MSLVEITILLALGAWLLRNLRPFLEWVQSQIHNPKSTARSQKSATPHSSFSIPHLSFLDWAMLAFALAATFSLGAAQLKDFALREYRLVIIEPVLFYFLLRFTPLDRRALWRIVDFFLLGAVLVAAIGLYQFITGANLITAEGGVERIRSVYGSPNNLALYLGRALPVGLAVLALGGNKRRRVLYGLAALVIGATIALTFSKGALLFGAPAALAVLLILWLGRWGWLTVGAGAAAALAALPFLNRLPRFAGILNPEGGTSFFRLRLWESAWRMFLDHPLFGVGLDNFLYQYRSRYILPEAWQDPNLSHPHNIVFDYLSRLGLLGFAAGVWLQAAFWGLGWEVYRRLRPAPGARWAGRESERRDLLALTVGLMASMADMLAHGLVDNSFFLVDLACAFCLTLALMQHLRRLAAEAGAG
jgi:O-antigen ligase